MRSHVAAMAILISRPLSAGTPLYRGTEPFRAEMRRSGAAVTSTLTFNSHSGTHIDVPSHYLSEGRKLSDLLPPLRAFAPAYCINARPSEGWGVTWDDIAPQALALDDARALLIRTGRGEERHDSQRYVDANPGIDISMADGIRKLRHIELIGFDMLSAASPLRQEQGDEVHRRLLGGERPILLMEDADLSHPGITSRAWRLTVAPLLAEDIDATPATAWLDPL